MLMFENVYRNVSPGLRSEVARFWKAAWVGSHEIESRIKHIVFIIRDQNSGTLAGVSSAENKKMPSLNNHHLYDFNWVIAAPYRTADQDVKLAEMTFDFLESINEQADHQPVGVFNILEDEVLKNDLSWRRAAWPELGMHLMGFTKSGNPIRVHYFKDAKI